MIESVVETRVKPGKVWQAWRKVHAMDAGFSIGQKGSLKAAGGSRFSYRILDVREGESFTILWKSMFVRMVFTHSVRSKSIGSEIRYQVQIRGLFAWPVRYFLSEKIRSNLQVILKALVRELESS